jgi:hypothetical protein
MKYLKTYESIIPIETNQSFWFVSIGHEDDSKYLFSDEESANNFLLYTINNDREYFDGPKEPFIYLEDAFEWRDIEGLTEEADYEIYEVKLSYKVDLPEEIKKMRQIDKYNL